MAASKHIVRRAKSARALTAQAALKTRKRHARLRAIGRVAKHAFGTFATAALAGAGNHLGERTVGFGLDRGHAYFENRSLLRAAAERRAKRAAAAARRAAKGKA